MKINLNHVKFILLLSCFTTITTKASTAISSEAGLCRYQSDPSKVLRFIQITDTHIDTMFFYGEEAKLSWTLTEGVEVVQPLFVVATGDLTDSTNGFIYGTGPHQEEWEKYRNIIIGAGMTPDFYFDLPGNHDVYGDEGASYYLNWSMQGAAQNTTQPQWRFDLPFGSYYFIGIATPCNDWLQWPFDNSEITDEEYNEIAENLENNADARLTLAFGHHNYFSEVRGGNRVDELFESYGIPYYLYGHHHDYEASVSNHNVVLQRVDSLGQSQNNNFCVWAIDSDCISHGCVGANNPWPLAVITAPVDAKLGPEDDVENPYSPAVPTSCTEAPIRVLVFDSNIVATVTYWWDTGEVGNLEKRGAVPSQWTGSFDATSFSPGIHTLTVEVIGSQTRDFTIQVNFEDIPCDTEEPPDEFEEEIGQEVIEENIEAELAEAIENIQESIPESASDALPDGINLIDAQSDGTVVDGGKEDTENEQPEGDLSGGGCSCQII